MPFQILRDLIQRGLHGGAVIAAGAADAYRTFRKLQHELRLQGAEKARVPTDRLSAERATVRRLWQGVIGD